MTELIDLAQKILAKHLDSENRILETVLLGYCDNKLVSEHISRYMFASRNTCGLVLDLASGSCYGSSILRRSDAVDNVVSVDIDRDLLLFGKTVYGINGCVQADATRSPFGEEKFDTVVCLETLEHVKDEEKFIENIKFCLKKRGYLILSTPNRAYFSFFLPKPLNPYHEREYYLGELLSFLRSHGFEVIDICGCSEVSAVKLIGSLPGNLLKFILNKLSLKYSAIDKVYSILELDQLIDPDPSLFPITKLKHNSNVSFVKYFVVRALKLK
jgi:SAM-dependent methyltransferase